MKKSGSLLSLFQKYHLNKIENCSEQRHFFHSWLWLNMVFALVQCNLMKYLIFRLQLVGWVNVLTLLLWWNLNDLFWEMREFCSYVKLLSAFLTEKKESSIFNWDKKNIIQRSIVDICFSWFLMYLIL